MEHVEHRCPTPEKQEDCYVCRSELFLCTVCSGGEGTLPRECPGRKMTEQEQKDVYAGLKDFLDGQWVEGAVAIRDRLLGDMREIFLADLGVEMPGPMQKFAEVVKWGCTLFASVDPRKEPARRAKYLEELRVQVVVFILQRSGSVIEGVSKLWGRALRGPTISEESPEAIAVHGCELALSMHRGREPLPEVMNFARAWVAYENACQRLSSKI